MEQLASERWYAEDEVWGRNGRRGELPLGRSKFKEMVANGELPVPILAAGRLIYTESMLRAAKIALLKSDRPGRGGNRRSKSK
ncbi:hypothetical protein [Parahaliea mediterranea]|uniref:hypothetical protein n=1 Tax=Parahaliea mediterranea TaxID=651086 RepID=UPI000E2E97D2|nr:hypothetical protein [Parahaliea mediterranea]